MIYWVNHYAATPGLPGGTRHAEMAHELALLGQPVTVVSTDFSLKLFRYVRRTSSRDHRAIREAVGQAEFVWLASGQHVRNDWRRVAGMLAFGLRAFWFLLRAPISEDTVFIGSSPHLIAAASTWLAARLRRAPFVFEVRDLWPESMAGVDQGVSTILVALLRSLADLLYRCADGCVVLARANIDHLVSRGADRRWIKYIPNGVSLAAFETDSVACSIELPSEERVFVYIGAHGPANGLGVVLDAAQLLEQQGSTALRVLLVGDGPAKRELELDAQSRLLGNVTFADPVPKCEIPSLLADCDAGLMILADVEVFRSGVSPNKLFDYMAADLPVISNVVGEVSRIIAEAGAGVSVPPRDPAALADAMTSLARSERRPSGASAYVMARHDRRMLAEELLHYLLQVREEHRSHRGRGGRELRRRGNGG